MEIESGVVSLPSSPDHQGLERLGATDSSCRQLWSTMTYPIRRLWSVVTHPIRLVISHVLSEIVGLFDGEIPTNPITYIVLLALLPVYLPLGVLRVLGVLWVLGYYIWIRLKIQSWEQIFVVSCIAVSLDTFFFYIPIINEENKCLGVDIKLRNTLLVLRSLTDFATLLRILFQAPDFRTMEDKNPDSHTDTDSYFDYEPTPTSYLFRKLKSMKEAIHGRMPWLSVSLIIDFLALLPIPQVAIIIVFIKMGGSNFDLKRSILNVFLIFQYVPRICQIYLSSKKVKKTGIWIKGVFNFFLYLLAGHVLASLWYFFSIQRETSCWHQNCRDVIGCKSTYECGNSVPRNISLLNEMCPINSPNATLFDFGIYLDLLQSGNTGAIEFPNKLFYSLWWGIRNLSNFGTNLETSSYIWENCFAILIGISGLLLFLYLIGNVQTYIQLATTKSVNIEEREEEIRRTRIGMKYREIKMWMSSNGLPEDLKREVREFCKQENIAPDYINAPVDLYFIKQVDDRAFWPSNPFQDTAFKENIRGDDFSEICQVYMKPVIYDKNSYIVRAGERCDRVVIIIEGVVELIDPHCEGTTETTARSTKRLEKGDHYPEELLDWALNPQLVWYDEDTLPTSLRDVICRTKVEAFYIEAKYLCFFIDDTEPTVPHGNTDATSNQIDVESETIKLEDIESKQMEKKKTILNQGREEPKEDVAVTGASTSSTTEQGLEQIIQHLQLLSRQIRNEMATQGQKLDAMAAFLATLGYPAGGVLPPPAP